MWDKKTLLVALTFLVLAPVSVYAASSDDVDDGDSATEATSNSVSTGHWYVGGSTGYLRPDADRLSGNTRTWGIQGGYQFNDRWSVDVVGQENTPFMGPGNDKTKIHSLSFTRYWGHDVRFLIEFGTTHISMNGGSNDNATSGFHIGAGLSTFITDNWELRGDARFVQTMNGNLYDGLGLLSLNYHFVAAKAVANNEEGSALGPSDTNESLPPMEYREAAEPVASEPVVEAPAPAPVAAAPKSIYTLLNFKFNSTDIEAQYGSQLDQISESIKASNSKAVIEGHTDSVGSNENNKILSMDRAIVVKRELKKRGVDGADLQAVGFGEERPIAPNDTEEGRKQNRRVEVKVYDK